MRAGGQHAMYNCKQCTPPSSAAGGDVLQARARSRTVRRARECLNERVGDAMDLFQRLYAVVAAGMAAHNPSPGLPYSGGSHSVPNALLPQRQPSGQCSASPGTLGRVSAAQPQTLQPLQRRTFQPSPSSSRV